jgi:hypothetical protein
MRNTETGNLFRMVLPSRFGSKVMIVEIPVTAKR